MSLRNNLYYIINHQSPISNSEFLIRFNPSHPIFAGHFPGQPIVPGACLVQIAQELLGEYLHQSVCFTSLRNLKFRQAITPDQEVTFIFQPMQEATFTFQLSSVNLIHAQFTATYMCTDTDVQ